MAVNKDNVKIHVSHLKKNFGSLEVLKDISTDIHEGEVVVIIGPSGSGKSTFLRCMNKLEEITAGEVIVDGHNLTDKHIDINKVRENVGMVFQHFNLFPHMNVTQNLMLAPVELKKATKDEARQRAIHMLEKVGMADKADTYPEQLSGGQKQRLSLGVALASGRRLLLYDEPTSGQDGENLLRTAQQITSANQNAVCTLMVTHDPELIFQCATHILHLKDGTPQAFFSLNRDGAARLWQIFGESEFDEFDSERSLNNMKHLSVWDQLVQLPYLNLYGKVVSSALELDLFTHLQEKKTLQSWLRPWAGTKRIPGICWQRSAPTALCKKRATAMSIPRKPEVSGPGTPDYLGGFIHFTDRTKAWCPWM